MQLIRTYPKYCYLLAENCNILYHLCYQSFITPKQQNIKAHKIKAQSNTNQNIKNYKNYTLSHDIRPLKLSPELWVSVTLSEFRNSDQFRQNQNDWATRQWKNFDDWFTIGQKLDDLCYSC